MAQGGCPCLHLLLLTSPSTSAAVTACRSTTRPRTTPRYRNSEGAVNNDEWHRADAPASTFYSLLLHRRQTRRRTAGRRRTLQVPRTATTARATSTTGDCLRHPFLHRRRSRQQ